VTGCYRYLNWKLKAISIRLQHTTYERESKRLIQEVNEIFYSPVLHPSLFWYSVHQTYPSILTGRYSLLRHRLTINVLRSPLILSVKQDFNMIT